jgi:ADP-ribosylglycohydrolase
LCDALLADAEHPERGFAESLVALFRAGAKRTSGHFGLHRGTGANFRRTVLSLDGGGAPWSGAQPSAGNGVAMMIAPLGWYFRGDLATLAERVVAVARVKQSDVRGIAAAASVAYVVAAALEGARPVELTSPLVDFVERVERAAAASLSTDSHVHTFSQGLDHMLALCGRRRSEVLQEIGREAARTSERRVHATSGYALSSVVTAIYMTLQAESLEELLIETVSLGGDADTTGAMVGAMGGALWGLDALPRRMLLRLRAGGAFDDRVEALVARRRDWRPRSSLIELEKSW